MIRLDDLVGPFPPCDSIIPLLLGGSKDLTDTAKFTVKSHVIRPPGLDNAAQQRSTQVAE